MTWLSQIDPRIWQAVIAGMFVAFGWIVNGRRNRREARHLRAEKTRDVHRALFAEIRAYLSTLHSEQLLRDHGQAMVAKMQEDADFVPFIPREHVDGVFETILPQIHVLPRHTIDPIVAYYSHVRAIATLVEDMRDKDFKAMEPARRIAMYSDYITMKMQALTFGGNALGVIKAYELGGVEAAQEFTRNLTLKVQSPETDTAEDKNAAEPGINTRAGDRSGRSQE